MDLLAIFSRPPRVRFVALAGLATALCCVACGESGPSICKRPETELPTDFHGGTVADGVYMSSDWDGDLLHFPGGAHYAIHHQLGAEPRWWQLYLSFERDGIESGTLVHAAGNQAEVTNLDGESITIVNGSCADYWLLVVAGVDG